MSAHNFINIIYIMVLIKDFKANTYFNAFILNAIVVAFIATVSIELRIILDETKHPFYIYVTSLVGKNLSEAEKFSIVFVATLLSAFIAYNVMYLVFNYGGGLITTTKKVNYF